MHTLNTCLHVWTKIPFKKKKKERGWVSFFSININKSILRRAWLEKIVTKQRAPIIGYGICNWLYSFKIRVLKNNLPCQTYHKTNFLRDLTIGTFPITYKSISNHQRVHIRLYRTKNQAYSIPQTFAHSPKLIHISTTHTDAFSKSAKPFTIATPNNTTTTCSTIFTARSIRV